MAIYRQLKRLKPGVTADLFGYSRLKPLRPYIDSNNGAAEAECYHRSLGKTAN
jgi:hypothetical protein